MQATRRVVTHKTEGAISTMPDYLVKATISSDGKPATRERIVRAKNEAGALRHVVADTITIDRATIDDAMRLAGNGGVVEIADAA